MTAAAVFHAACWYSRASIYYLYLFAFFHFFFFCIKTCSTLASESMFLVLGSVLSLDRMDLSFPIAAHIMLHSALVAGKV